MRIYMIKVSSLFKKDVYKNVSFDIDRGVLCILSKKPERSSALLDALAGVKRADGGAIDGNVKTAYISKGVPLPGSLTADEYLTLVSKIKDGAEIPDTALSFTEDLSTVRIEKLSAAERLTLGVAASLIGEPDVIVIEEPYYGLSFDDYGDVKELLRTVSEETAVVFSSSSVYESKEISDKTLVMSAGTQIYFGDTDTLYGTDINETDIVCIVKGDREALMSALERFSPEIEDTVRESVYCVTVKAVPIFRAAETRGRIKKLLSKARLSLLDISSEKEALLNIIGELSENDRVKRAALEEKKPEKIKMTKITKSLVAFSHDEDGEDGEYEAEEDAEDSEDSENYSEDE